MPTRARNVMQLKVTLLAVKPRIWRRIVVPESYSFWDLHVAIQDAMGWTDTHLHLFEVVDPSFGEPVQIGIPDDGGWDDGTLPGWKHKIARYFPKERVKARYVYDFGDGWEHDVVLEKRLPAQDAGPYPVCTAGERRCPPEDCGGAWGYAELLEAIRDPAHERHVELTEWIAGDFDPEAFNPGAVVFEDPRERLKLVSRRG
jgi:pRiA4b ORF-3-like protein